MRVIKIEEIELDTDIYPRMKTAWLTAYQYAQAMKTGSVFPPISLGKFKGKLFLVDGWHRVEARKLLNEEYIEAVIKDYREKREMFADAVKLNSMHGRRLSIQEIVRITYKLEQWKFEKDEISEIIKIPIDKIEGFKIRTIIGPDGKPVYLKAPLAKTGATDFLDQSLFNVSSVPNLLQQFILALENDMLMLDDVKVKELAVKIYGLLGEKLGLVEAKA